MMSDYQARRVSAEVVDIERVLDGERVLHSERVLDAREDSLRAGAIVDLNDESHHRRQRISGRGRTEQVGRKP